MATSKEKAEVKAEAEVLKRNEDVRRALKQTATHKEMAAPVVETRHKVWLGTYALVLVGLGGLYYLFSLSFFGFATKYQPYLLRFTRGIALVVLVLGLGQAISIFLIERVDDAASRYNLNRIRKLLTGFIIILIIISVVFVNWYTAIFSVGLLSLILGLALQTTFTSFIGWIYILVRAPYRVGDRIKIGDATGDVIDVGYLDTTLWEFGGQYLSTDHPSGRVIRFPNSNILDSAVYNYSWPLFPYIWNEIKFQIAYESDLEFVAQTMQQVAEEEIGQAMIERVRVFRELLAQTPVDELEVQEHPVVLFRVNDNTWLDAILRYLVPPREAGRIKTRLIKKLLERLNAEPERVLFPKGNSR
jgi:small-conductance mechanosensitive channel